MEELEIQTTAIIISGLSMILGEADDKQKEEWMKKSLEALNSLESAVPTGSKKNDELFEKAKKDAERSGKYY